MTADLIARLESAEAWNRELDWSLAKMLAYPRADLWPDVEIWPPFVPGSRSDKSIPAFTTSLDAITALIAEKLPGWTWEASNDGHAYLWSPDNDDAMVCGANAKTPSFALCIALLRALNQGGGNG